jgi:hypothetical protein
LRYDSITFMRPASADGVLLVRRVSSCKQQKKYDAETCGVLGMNSRSAACSAGRYAYSK